MTTTLAATACGPKPPADDGGTTNAVTTSVTTSGESTSSTAHSTDIDPTTGEPGTSTGEPPLGPCPDPTDDIFDIEPYRFCLGGHVEFAAHEFLDGPPSYSGYAQFFTVFAESQIVWDEVIHDPFEGLDDCGARTIGNSGVGDSEEVLWEDAGDLTFLAPEFSVLAKKYGDPQSVIGYDGAFHDLGHTPAWGQLHGIVTTGATTPALDLPQAVHLPDRIELTSPSLLDATLDHEAATFTWKPSPLGLPTWLNLHFPAGDKTLTIYCQMVDDGAFQVPAALLELAELPRSAQLYLSRIEVRTYAIDDARAARVVGRASVDGQITVE